MNRRDTLLSLLALGAAAPIWAQGQVSVRKLGVLSLGLRPSAEAISRSAFFAKLKQLGWIEGQNLSVIRAYANLKRERLRTLAEDLVREQVDVIYAAGSEAAVAAARVTATIPIVFGFVGWPIEMGLIDSFPRPGRNVTGVASYVGQEVSIKRHEYLRDIAPDAKRLSWITAPDIAEKVQGGTTDFGALTEAGLRKLGYEVTWHPVYKVEDLEAAFSKIAASGAQALSVASGALLNSARERIADFALKNRLPSASIIPQFAEVGGLLCYGPAGVFSTTPEKIAEYVDRILRGSRPAEMPVDRPSRYELAINMKTANALGLKVPQVLLLRADHVIQ
jgi:ABC-type uncharacterized transport system substrate-binding protein